MRYSRQNKILELISRYEVGTQEELCQLLKPCLQKESINMQYPLQQTVLPMTGSLKSLKRRF